MNTELKITSEPLSQDTVIFHLQGWLDAQSEQKLITASEEAHQQ